MNARARPGQQPISEQAGRSGEPARARSKTWIEREGKVVLSDWRADLLEEIERSGSLARAAEAMSVPYRTAWYKLKEIEEQLGIRLLETHSGGLGGGRSTLTVEAQELVRRFRTINDGVSELVSQRFEAEFGEWSR